MFSDFDDASGQLINLSKSGVFFSPRFDPLKLEIQQILGVKPIPLDDRYVGTPLFTNKFKIKSFEPLVEIMLNRLVGWNGTDLNTTGKYVMIKTVTSSLTVYQMNCFKISKAIYKKLSNIQRDFWWGKNEKGKNDQGKKGCI